MSHSRTVRTVALLGVLVLASLHLAAAQVDDRARELLAGLQPPAGETIDSLEQVMVMTIFAGGGEQTVRTKSSIDYVGRRAAIAAEIAPGMSTTIIITDDDVQMRMGGMTIPLPPGMTDAYEGIFDRAPEDVLAEGASASYDGVHSYGGLVEGEQVTLSGSAPIAGLEQAGETRMLFDGEGRLLAVVVDSGEGLMLMLFDEPVTGSAVVGRNATMYLLEADEPERFATMAFEEIRINEPFAEGTFD
jgi:hypothetical protein